MRRPVIFLFLSFIFGIALEYHLILGPFHFLFFAFSLTGLYFASRVLKWRREQVGLVCFFLSVALIGSAYFSLAEHRADPLEAAEGEIRTVEGRIVTVQVKDAEAWQILITAEGAGKRLIQVRGVPADPAECVGRWAVVRGTVALPSERRNPGLFDYRLYLKTKDVRVILQCNDSQITLRQDKSSFIFSKIAGLKYGFMEKLERRMEPKAYGLMVGMLFGDRSLIGDDTYESFQKNGIAHILSVSGIHVGIVYLCISRLLGNRKTRVFYFLTALMLIFYAALSEFSPSVVRAVVMISIHMFSKVSWRRYDFISCTAASALVMLLFNPFYLFNVGFQLSYLAVFCLAALLPWANRKLDHLEESGRSELAAEALRWFAPLFIIQVGMAPMTAYLFNYFSIAALLMNMPIIAISGMIIPLGVCLIPISVIGGPIFGAGAQAAELLIDFMLWLNQLFYLPGIGFFNMVSPPVFLLLVFYGFFFFLSSEYLRILYQRGRRKGIAICCCLIFLLSVVMSAAAGGDYHDADLVFIDVGQGDCLYIRTPEGKNILIDGGGSLNYKVGEKILLPYLLKNGARSVDLAVVTHLHDDHYLGLKELAGKMKIDKLGVYDGNRLREPQLLAETGLKKDNMLYLAEGDRITIGDEVQIVVLYPEERPRGEYEKLLLEKEDENSSSLILKVYYKGLTVLMTGDLGLEGEKELLDYYEDDPEALQADVLKIGHHGSRYSTGDEFLAAIGPKIAVFQVGKNNFGHPHPSVIEKCSKKGIIVYRNDKNGAIIFFNEDEKWHIRVLLPKNMHIKE